MLSTKNRDVTLMVGPYEVHHSAEDRAIIVTDIAVGKMKGGRPMLVIMDEDLRDLQHSIYTVAALGFGLGQEDDFEG